MKTNPYNLFFRQVPSVYMDRSRQTEVVLNAFLNGSPESHAYIFTGVHGSGKTVMLTAVEKDISSNHGWKSVDVDPSGNIISGIVEKLLSDEGLLQVLKETKVNLSLFGIGVSVGGEKSEKSPEIQLETILQGMKKKGQKLLITIDDVAATKEMKFFASRFQNYIRHDLPVYLLMTGLSQNIQNLQDENNLTFLYRCPKIMMTPLNVTAMADQYQQEFNLEREDARNMARMTRGYSFAFQVLGHYTWENNGNYQKALPQTKIYLAEMAYDKIWSELSNKDKEIMMAICNIADKNNGKAKVQVVREKISESGNTFNQYRRRLITAGLLDGSEHGWVYITLPFFEQYVLETYGE